MKRNTTTATETIDATPVALEAAIAALRQLQTSDRLLGLYELGLEGCTLGSTEQVTIVLEELISTLDFTYADIAEGFQRVYEYCLMQSRAGAFDRVNFVLTDLRDTLARAIQDVGEIREAAKS